MNYNEDILEMMRCLPMDLKKLLLYYWISARNSDLIRIKLYRELLDVTHDIHLILNYPISLDNLERKYWYKNKNFRYWYIVYEQELCGALKRDKIRLITNY